MAFPSTLDTIPVTPVGTAVLGTGSHTAIHTAEKTLAESIQAKVGIDGSAVTTSLDYKLKNTTSGHDHDGSDSKKVVATNLDVTGLTPSKLLAVNAGGTAVVSNGLTIPSSDFVGKDDTQTLTVKTLTTPVIASLYQDAGLTKLMTVPNTASDTLTANAATQTLTNKTLSTGVALNANASENFTYHGNSRQMLINGNFDVWQRGTSFAATVAVTYNADRWSTQNNGAGTDQEGTVTRQTASLDGSLYSIRYQRTAGETGTSVMYLTQPLEARDTKIAHGKKLTLSYWAKCGANFSAASSNLGAFIVSQTGAENNLFTTTGFAGEGGGNNVLTTSWQKFTWTTPTTIANTKTQLFVYFGATPVGTAGANDWFEVTQVQLCVGDVALPFQAKSYMDELLDCKRFCFSTTTVAAAENIAMGPAASTTVAYTHVPLQREMRKVPTLTATAADWQLDDTVNAPTNVTGLAIDDLTFSNTKMVTLKASAASGLTQYRTYYLVGDGTTGRVIILDAEIP